MRCSDVIDVVVTYWRYTYCEQKRGDNAEFGKFLCQGNLQTVHLNWRIIPRKPVCRHTMLQC